MMWDGMGSMGGFAWFWMIVWGVFLVLLVVLAVLAVVWLARNLGGGESRTASGDGYSAIGGAGEPASAMSAREVLDWRYARGELGREEYQQARRDLESPVG